MYPDGVRIEPKDGATLEVRTHREGVLSAVGHDLSIVAPRFTIDIDGDPATGNVRSVVLAVDARALSVDGALTHDGVDRSVLSAHERRDIERSMRDDVLAADANPSIGFRADRIKREGDGFSLEGELSLAGRSRPIALRAERRGADVVAEVTIHQPDFGIRPFRAMLGALKVRADVSVRVTVPARALGLA